MTNVLLWKTYVAHSAIPGYHIVHPNNADGQVKLADAGADKASGVSGRGDVKTGERVEVAHVGIADVMFGGAVTRGDLLRASATNNKHGRAVTASSANDRTIGVALTSGADGDIGQVLLSFSQVK